MGCARIALLLYKPTFRSLFKIFRKKPIEKDVCRKKRRALSQSSFCDVSSFLNGRRFTATYKQPLLPLHNVIHTQSKIHCEVVYVSRYIPHLAVYLEPFLFFLCRGGGGGGGGRGQARRQERGGY